MKLSDLSMTQLMAAVTKRLKKGGWMPAKGTDGLWFHPEYGRFSMFTAIQLEIGLEEEEIEPQEE
jgi:hypothetical protein